MPLGIDLHLHTRASDGQWTPAGLVARAASSGIGHIAVTDHDVTDDWNLTADWERCAYGHPFSKRIIGNALVAYLQMLGTLVRFTDVRLEDLRQ